ncbi:unnamed protein product [Chrysoparadoxa australica]
MSHAFPDKIEITPLSSRVKLAALDLPIAFKEEASGCATAIKMLGGEEVVKSVIQDPSKTLGLTMRPGDKACQLIPSSRNSSKNSIFAVKVKRRRKRGSSEWSVKSAEVLGQVDSHFKFDNLADIQFLTSKTLATIGPAPSTCGILEATPVFFPHKRLKPFSFQECSSSHPQAQDDPEGVHIDHINKRVLGFPCVVVKFQDPAPQLPEYSKKFIKEAEAARAETEANEAEQEKMDPSEHSKERRSRDAAMLKRYATMNRMQSLIDKQPIWSRGDMLNALPKWLQYAAIDTMSTLLYRSTSGPWRMLWVKFGYDLKAHPEARFFQKVDFRISPTALKHYKARVFQGQSLQSDSAEGAAAGGGADAGAGADAGQAKGAKAARAQGPHEVSINFCGHELACQNNYTISELPRELQEKALISPRLSAPCKESGWFVLAFINQARHVLSQELERTVGQLQRGEAVSVSERMAPEDFMARALEVGDDVQVIQHPDASNSQDGNPYAVQGAATAGSKGGDGPDEQEHPNAEAEEGMVETQVQESAAQAAASSGMAVDYEPNGDRSASDASEMMDGDDDVDDEEEEEAEEEEEEEADDE